MLVSDKNSKLVTQRENEWKMLIEGKSVALVGGHDEVDWRLVDQADIVVRVNAHWLRQGGRCEVLYYSCENNLPVEMFDRKDLYGWPGNLNFAWLNASHSLFNQGDHLKKAYCRIRENGVPVATYYAGPPELFKKHIMLKTVPPEQHWTKEVAEQFNFHALTGILALAHLVRYPSIKSIYVTGMTMYRQEDGNLPVKAGTHHIEPQLQFLRWVSQDSRVLMSKLLRSAIDH